MSKFKKYDFSQGHDEKVREIICILDGSGSMITERESAISGFNHFLAKQKKKRFKGKTLLTLCIFHDNPSYDFSPYTFPQQGFGGFGQGQMILGQFNNQFRRNNAKLQVVYNRVDINEVEPLSYMQYECHGNTPLYDSIGTVLNTVMANRHIRPQIPTLCVIMTDGGENSSQEYNKSRIRNMIDSYKNMNWSFLFMGANMTSFSEYEDIGLKGFTVSMSNNRDGYNSAWNCVDACFNNVAVNGTLSKSCLDASVAMYSANLSTDKIK